MSKPHTRLYQKSRIFCGEAEAEEIAGFVAPLYAAAQGGDRVRSTAVIIGIAT